MTDKTQINFELTRSFKEDMDRYAKESPEYESLSQLIRGAVRKEMAQSGQTTTSTVDLSPILSELSDINESLDGIDRRLTTVENQVRRDPELEKLANQVLRILPTERPGTREWTEELENRQYALEAAETGQESDEEGARKAVKTWEGTVEGIATALESDQTNVRRALDKLRADTHLVNSVTLDGEPRYYKED